MNFYEKVMSFYIGNTHSSVVMIGGRKKLSMSISGKANKASIIVFMIMSAFFIGVSALLLSNHSSENGDWVDFLTNIYEPVRNRIGVLSALAIIIASSLVAILIVFIIHKLIFNRIERKINNINIYQRELPTKLRPAHVRMLLKDGCIDSKSLACTILDLIDRDYLEIVRDNKTDKFSKLDIFKKGDIILRRTNKPVDDLLFYEQFIIDWFVNKCGDGKEVTSNK